MADHDSSHWAVVDLSHQEVDLLVLFLVGDDLSYHDIVAVVGIVVAVGSHLPYRLHVLLDSLHSNHQRSPGHFHLDGRHIDPERIHAGHIDRTAVDGEAADGEDTVVVDEVGSPVVGQVSVPLHHVHIQVAVEADSNSDRRPFLPWKVVPLRKYKHQRSWSAQEDSRDRGKRAGRLLGYEEWVLEKPGACASGTTTVADSRLLAKTVVKQSGTQD